jgi:tetratricopeptide (TPR) repeat protein
VNINRGRLIGLGLVIFAGTVWLYWPALHGGFLVSMDDDAYLQESARLNGLTWNAVKWTFTTATPYYHPLPWLSHVLDYEMWGRNAAGHHATSVVLHAFNAVLVFGFLWTLLGAASLTTAERLLLAWGSAVVFAIHPLQVESVAWMSGRTQVLCTTFGVGCVWAYAAGGRRWVVWVLFVLALLCKPMAVSLPFAMLAMDYFPLGRYKQLGWRRLLGEKAVMIALGVAVGLATTASESRSNGLMVSLGTISLSDRVFLMFQSLMFYAWKLVWPAHLLPFYPLSPGLSLEQWPVLVSVLGVVTITAVAAVERRRIPMLAAAWGAYAMFILPVSGLMQTGAQAIATRYAYLAMLPLLLLAGGVVVWIWRRSITMARVALAGLFVCEACVFGADTRRLIPVWQDDETLWHTTLAQFPDSLVANRALMTTLLNERKFDEALQYARRNVEIAPDTAESHNNLGFVLMRLGRIEEAIVEYEQAVQIDPNYAEGQSNLGTALVRVGKYDEALVHYQQSLRVKPALAETHYDLAVALIKLGRKPEAIEELKRALTLQPDFTPARDVLARQQANP